MELKYQVNWTTLRYKSGCTSWDEEKWFFSQEARWNIPTKPFPQCITEPVHLPYQKLLGNKTLLFRPPGTMWPMYSITRLPPPISWLDDFKMLQHLLRLPLLLSLSVNQSAIQSTQLCDLTLQIQNIYMWDSGKDASTSSRERREGGGEKDVGDRNRQGGMCEGGVSNRWSAEFVFFAILP